MLRCITGKLKPRRFEPSRSTGSKVFFLLTCLDANNCICLAKCLYSFRDDWPDWTKALPKNSRSPFPVDVRRSKTSFICFHYYLAGFASKRKIQDRSISSRSRVYRLYKSFSFTEKQPRKPETVIKDGFVEMKHEFPFETFRPERQDYLFRCFLLVLSFAPRGFSPGTPVFPSSQKPTFPNSNSTRSQVDEEPICGCATSKSLFIYLFLFIMFRCFWKFTAGTTQKVVFHLLSNRIFRKFFVNGKRTLAYLFLSKYF